jgi:hypothetical protein
MARIQAGSTLVNQYAPPFVVSDSVAQGWELQWNETLQAFEAVDPNANVINAGFDTIESAIFADVTQQVFVVPWTAASKESLIITIDGVKQHTDVYTIFADSASNTTTITLSDTVSNETVEVVGLQTTGGASVELFPAAEVDTIPGTVDAYYVLNWFAPTTESVIVSVDGVKQHTNTYSVVPEPGSNYTQTRLTFSDRRIDFQADTGPDAGGDFITTDVAHGYEDGQGVYYSNRGGTDVPGLTDGTLYYVNSITAFTLSLHTTKADAVGDANRVDITGVGGAETHTLTLVSGPYLSIDSDLIALVNGGTGYNVGDTIKISGGTGATEAVITVLSETGGVIDAGVGVGFDLTLIGEYIVFPSPNEPAPTTTLTGVGASATFNVYPDRPKIEVVGITTTGETPASPVNATNLGSPDDATIFGLYNSKTVTNDTQVLNFKSISEGTNVTMALAGDTVQISATNPLFAEVTAGGTSLFDESTIDQANPTFRTLQAGTNIALSVAGADAGIVIAENFNYLTSADATITLTTERLVNVLPAGATTVNLPVASTVTAGDTITIKDANGTAATNNIAVTPNGTDDIDGVNAAVTLNTNRAYITLYSDGTDWHIIGQG